MLPEGTAGPLNPGPHGFSEILYAFSSQTGNNGSAFAGLTGNTPFYNITGALAMLIGRYGMIVPDPRPGRLDGRQAHASRRRWARSRRPGVLWTVLLIGVVIIVGALTFFPALSLGPIVEQLLQNAGGDLTMSLTNSLLSVDLGRGTRRFQRFVTLRRHQTERREPPRPRGVLDPDLLRSALPHAFRKLDPRLLIKNPVMFVVEITAVLVTLIWLANVTGSQAAASTAACGFQVQIAIWLWFTVLFATYAEAVAEARGRAQAATLRKTRTETKANRRRTDGTLEDVGSSELRKGDIIVVEEGQTIPGDGDVIEGVGFVNEAAITGESAPVLKEPGTDIRSSVTGGTTLVSDRLVVRVTADPGETFLDRMIALVEGAKRQRTPNEIALAILLAGLTIVFLMATVTLRPFGPRGHDGRHGRAGGAARLPDPDDDRR